MPGSYTWPLANPPPTTGGGGTGATSGSDLLAEQVGVNRIVRGIVTPFQRDQISDFASGTGAALLRSKIGQILGTRGDSDFVQGELPWRTDFGSLLQMVRHSNNDDVAAELARVYAADAVARWLPSVRITAADIVRERTSDGENTLAIRFLFEVRDARSTLVAADALDVPVASS